MVRYLTEEQSASVLDLGLETKKNSSSREDIDHFTTEAVDAYVAVVVDALQSMNVPPLVGVVLYGSRARGDHTIESDADLAIVLKGREDGRALQILEELRKETYAIEAQFGFMVSPTVIWSDVLGFPALSSNPAFYRNILADGISWNY